MSISDIFNNYEIEKTFNQYYIKINGDIDIIQIQIHNKKTIIIYESYFKFEYLHKNILFQTCKSIYEIIELISNLIDGNNIKIEENNNNLKIVLYAISLKIELILKKKNLLSNEFIENLINEINLIKNEYKDLKDKYDILNKKIELIEKDNRELSKSNELIKNEVNKMNNRIELIEKENDKLKNEKFKEIERRLNKLEIFHKNKIQLTKCNLIKKKSIKAHKKYITSISTFPSGNIISVASDLSFKIFDIHLNLLQKKKNAHNNVISYVEVKDENNFITCSYYKSIKLWIKNENEFKMYKTIDNAHQNSITKVIYCSNGNLISCSLDYKIIIWKQNNSNFIKLKELTHSNIIYSILLVEDKNILVSCGMDGTRLWNINIDDINSQNINCIKDFKETNCKWYGGLCRLDEDRLIIQGNIENTLKVISISKKIIIQDINNPFLTYGIILIEDKGIFLIGGLSKDIRVYRSDNYECIQTIKNAHNNNIFGFVELKDGTIASFSWENDITIWSF